MNTALEKSKHCARLISLIDEALLELQKKRVTLEEKALVVYFHEIIQRYALLLFALHLRIIKHLTIDNELLDRLQQINERLEAQLNELIKVLHYDLNFLEQYFEYDYYARLTQENSFLQELEELSASLN